MERPRSERGWYTKVVFKLQTPRHSRVDCKFSGVDCDLYVLKNKSNKRACHI